MTRSVGSSRYRVLALPVIAVAGASILFAACSSSTKAASTTPATSVAPPAAGGAPSTAAPSKSNASDTLSAASIPGLGTALVDGNGRTLYVLASEKGGKVTCTVAGGCAVIWPAVVLPSGMSHGIASSGVQPSLLGTVTGPAGDVRLTYGGWPLYTFVGDTGSGTAKGEGVKDAFGLWWALSPSGEPITKAASTPASAAPTPAPTPATPTTAAPQSGGAGF